MEHFRSMPAKSPVLTLSVKWLPSPEEGATVAQNTTNRQYFTGICQRLLLLLLLLPLSSLSKIHGFWSFLKLSLVANSTVTTHAVHFDKSPPLPWESRYPHRACDHPISTLLVRRRNLCSIIISFRIRQLRQDINPPGFRFSCSSNVRQWNLIEQLIV